MPRPRDDVAGDAPVDDARVVANALRRAANHRHRGTDARARRRARVAGETNGTTTTKKTSVVPARDDDDRGRARDRVPTDWTLKSNIRFSSQASLAWMAEARAEAASEGVCAHARVRALEGKNASLVTENEALEGDLREYRAEVEHLDEIIAQAEDDLARVLAEKQSLERELAAKSAASIKNLIKSPFSPLTTSAAGTPRLSAAMRWIEDTIATPIRSPFADLKQTSDAPEVETVDVVPASATKRAVSVGKSRLRLGASPLPKTPGAACEDSAEDAGAYDTDCESVGGASPLPLVEPVIEHVVAPVKESRRWRFGFAKVPESRMYGVPLDRVGSLRLRIVGDVSLVNLVA